MGSRTRSRVNSDSSVDEVMIMISAIVPAGQCVENKRHIDIGHGKTENGQFSMMSVVLLTQCFLQQANNYILKIQKLDLGIEKYI